MAENTELFNIHITSSNGSILKLNQVGFDWLEKWVKKKQGYKISKNAKEGSQAIGKKGFSKKNNQKILRNK